MTKGRYFLRPAPHKAGISDRWLFRPVSRRIPCEGWGPRCMPVSGNSLLQCMSCSPNQGECLFDGRHVSVLEPFCDGLEAVVQNVNWSSDLFALVAGPGGFVDAQLFSERSLGLPAPGRLQKIPLRCRELHFNHVAIIASYCNNCIYPTVTAARYHPDAEETWPGPIN